MKDGMRVPLFELGHVTVVRGEKSRKKILNDVSLKVFAGECTAILGPNGAGKSTLVRVLTREIYPRTGARTVCRVLGRDRWNIFDLRSRLGIVSNDLQALCARDISGLETVLSGFTGGIGLHGSRLPSGARTKAREVLRFLGIAHLEREKMAVMSSGEARRFLIARALVHDPGMLVLDEPSASLDLRAQRQFRKMLGRIARAGTGIVLVTQDLRDIVPEIKRVVLMKDGRIAGDGTPGDMLTSGRIGRVFGLRISVRKIRGVYDAL